MTNKLRIGAILLASSMQFAKPADAMSDRGSGGVVGGGRSGSRGGPGLSAGRYVGPGGGFGGVSRFGGGGYYGTGTRHFAGSARFGEAVVGGRGARTGGAIYLGANGNVERHGFGWNGYADNWNYWPAGNASGFAGHHHGFGWNYGYEFGNEYYYRYKLSKYHGWAGPVFWPYAYNDIYLGAFAGIGYYNPIWEYGYEDIYGGLFSADGYDDLAGYPPVGGRPGGRAVVRGAAGHNGVARVARVARRGETVEPPSGPVTQPVVPPRGGQVTQLTEPPNGVTVPQPAEPLCGADTKEITVWPIKRIQQLVMPNGVQQAALDEFEMASTKAAQMIKAACPAAPASTATGRLEAMEVRIEAMRHAIEIIRGPMDKFYSLLTHDQKARLATNQAAGNRPATGRGGALTQNCAAANSAIQWPTAQIEKAVRPTGEQLGRLSALKEAAAAAAARLAACPPETRMTPPARLAAMSERLEVMQQSVKEVRAALDEFYNSLTDEQKARFDALGRTGAAH